MLTLHNTLTRPDQARPLFYVNVAFCACLSQLAIDERDGRLQHSDEGEIAASFMSQLAIDERVGRLQHSDEGEIAASFI